MNSLSWLLYAADVFGGLKVAAIVAVLGAVVAAFLLPPKGVQPFSGDHLPFSGISRGSVWAVAVISSAILVFVPSRDTIMLIATSEVGESVLASEQVQEIGGEAGALATDSLRVLRKFINEQLGSEE